MLTLSACASLTPGQRLGKEIVGSWIVAGYSSDYVPVPMHERFFADGTYRIYWYADASCTDVIAETHLTWRIANGILISKITYATSSGYGRVGDVMTAKIISLGRHRMVLHSLDDGSTYVRVRSTACLAPRQISV